MWSGHARGTQQRGLGERARPPRSAAPGADVRVGLDCMPLRVAGWGEGGRA